MASVQIVISDFTNLQKYFKQAQYACNKFCNVCDFWHVAKRPAGTPYNYQSEAESMGLRIRKLRKEIGMTQLDLAIAAGIDVSTVLRIEKARLVITVDVLFGIASALQVSPKELFD